MMPTVEEMLRQKLAVALDPIHLEIKDNSASHAGHAGHRPEGGTHFALCIVSAHFTGLNRLQRHRLVHRLLEQELAIRIHALELDLKTPDEHNL